eukprot:jgi/Tetstr1/422317/TSEL_013161.t2
MVLTGEVERPVVISFTPKQLEPVRLHIFISTIRKIFSIYEVLVALIEQIPGMMRDKMSKVKDPSQWVICTAGVDGVLQAWRKHVPRDRASHKKGYNLPQRKDAQGDRTPLFQPRQPRPRRA